MTWLEAVYDLVFVVAVGALASRIEDRITVADLLRFVGLYVAVWWGWAGQTFYATRFDTDDTSHRLLAGLQMVAVTAMAAALPRALDRDATVFALGYAGLRAILVVQYLRARHHVPAARALTTRYAAGFAAGAVLWAVSAAVPAPARFGCWAVALVVEYATPLFSRRLQAEIPPDTSHLPERFGLFTIIVLGQTVTSIVAGLGRQPLGAAEGGAAVLALLVVLSLWWAYFANVDEQVVRRTRLAGQLWVYGHLPLVIGITALGVGIGNIISTPVDALSAETRWLACGSLAATLAALALLHAVAEGRHHERIRMAGAVAALGVGVAGAGLPGMVIAAGLAAIALAQVVVDLDSGHAPA